MTTLIAYLRIALFTAGTLVGVQLPVFVDQYGKSLEAHYRESRLSLAAFQDEADRYFEGDIQRLIRHYKNSGDAVFIEGGGSIDSIFQRSRALQQALEEFRRSDWSAYRQAIINPLGDIREEVVEGFSYAVILRPAAIGWGMICGLLLACTCELLLRALVAIPARLLRPRPSRRQP